MSHGHGGGHGHRGHLGLLLWLLLGATHHRRHKAKPAKPWQVGFGAVFAMAFAGWWLGANVGYERRIAAEALATTPPPTILTDPRRCCGAGKTWAQIWAERTAADRKEVKH